MRAHPRSRGENHHLGVVPVIPSGSSPLTRGKPGAVNGRYRSGRLIPAHAGKTRGATGAAWPPAAHPRSRGENCAVESRVLADGGSSPLTRGKPERRGRWQRRHRLIPAHAGKTRSTPAPGTSSRAHPRSRGENDHVAEFLAATPGSSPLTRGKHAVDRRALVEERLIPAHAGKTVGIATESLVPTAHPRSRGENLITTRRIVCPRGSSPLTRGKPYIQTLAGQLSRLIPAHAGKTVAAWLACAACAAHPRSRGENSETLKGLLAEAGSSPLTRGKRKGYCYDVRHSRLIPAHAGKTAPTANPGSMSPAHPRSRGENSAQQIAAKNGDGSSPLTRGKRSRLLRLLELGRLIPAHAGKTTAPGRRRR